MQLFLQWKNNNCYIFDCVFVTLGIQHAMRMLLVVICGFLGLHFSTLYHNCTFFSGKNVVEHEIVCLFSRQLLSERFLILRRTEQSMIKNVYCSSRNVPVILVRF